MLAAAVIACFVATLAAGFLLGDAARCLREANKRLRQLEQERRELRLSQIVRRDRCRFNVS